MRRKVAALTLVFLATLAFMSCAQKALPTAPSTPTADVSQAPTPTPDRCVPSFCEIQGDRIVFGIGPKQERELKLLIFDPFRTPIDNKCDFDRRVTWDHDGPIEPTGGRNGSAFTYYAVTTGKATVGATVASAPRCFFNITIEN